MQKSLLRAFIVFLCISITANAKLFWRHKIPSNSDVIKIINKSSDREVTFTDQFKVLVWNMYKGANDSWADDFNFLAQDSDLIISQEFFLEDKMKDVFTDLFEFEFVTATSFYWKGETRTGVMTAARTRAISSDFTRSKYREPIVMTPKVLLTTKYMLSNGRILLVANIHAVNIVSSRKLESQLNDIKNTIAKHKGPVIFAGDFNVWTKKKTRMLRRYMDDLNLVEIKYDKSVDKRMRINNKPLDYIFYRDLKLVEADVLGDIKGADHKPLTASFRID